MSWRQTCANARPSARPALSKCSMRSMRRQWLRSWRVTILIRSSTWSLCSRLWANVTRRWPGTSIWGRSTTRSRWRASTIAPSSRPARSVPSAPRPPRTRPRRIRSCSRRPSTVSARSRAKCWATTTTINTVWTPVRCASRALSPTSRCRAAVRPTTPSRSTMRRSGRAGSPALCRRTSIWT